MPPRRPRGPRKVRGKDVARELQKRLKKAQRLREEHPAPRLPTTPHRTYPVATPVEPIPDLPPCMRKYPVAMTREETPTEQPTPAPGGGLCPLTEKPCMTFNCQLWETDLWRCGLLPPSLEPLESRLRGIEIAAKRLAEVFESGF